MKVIYTREGDNVRFTNRLLVSSAQTSTKHSSDIDEIYKCKENLKNVVNKFVGVVTFVLDYC